MVSSGRGVPLEFALKLRMGRSGVVGSPAAARCSVRSGPGLGDVPWCPPGAPVASAVLGVAFSVRARLEGAELGDAAGTQPTHLIQAWVLAG